MKRQSEEIFKLPMDEFLKEVTTYIPSEYGKKILKKITIDSKDKLQTINEFGLEKGDCTIAKKVYFEHASSVINKNEKYGIRNIRPWQNFDNFILTLIDNRDGKIKVNFYCVSKDVILNNPVLKLSAQNSSKDINSENKYVPMSCTFEGYEHNWLFSSHNLLKGTSYKDLQDYINDTHNSVTEFAPNQGKKQKAKETKRSKRMKVSFKYGIELIVGNTNNEAFVNLIKKVGQKRLNGVLRPSMYSTKKTIHVNVPCGHGYYLANKLSYRDIVKLVMNINEKLNLKIKILVKQ